MDFLSCFRAFGFGLGWAMAELAEAMPGPLEGTRERVRLRPWGAAGVELKADLFCFSPSATSTKTGDVTMLKYS